MQKNEGKDKAPLHPSSILFVVVNILLFLLVLILSVICLVSYFKHIPDCDKADIGVGTIDKNQISSETLVAELHIALNKLRNKQFDDIENASTEQQGEGVRVRGRRSVVGPMEAEAKSNETETSNTDMDRTRRGGGGDFEKFRREMIALTNR